MHVLPDRNWASVSDFVTDFNRCRTAHKNKWLVFKGSVCGKHVEIKNYKLWMQILMVDGIHHEESYPYQTVTEWKAAIANALAYKASEINTCNS